MIDEKYRQFLLGPAAADKVRHSGRSLYAHLCGTHDLLQAWGNDAPVCAAGLFHSIYGTARFHHKAWPISDRRTIAELIGPEAELMAYVFCTAERPKWIIEAVEVDEYPGLICRLREIEAANLLEQGSRSHWLKRLHDSDISAAAKLAIAATEGALDVA